MKLQSLLATENVDKEITKEEMFVVEKAPEWPVTTESVISEVVGTEHEVEKKEAPTTGATTEKKETSSRETNQLWLKINLLNKRNQSLNCN